MSGNVIDGENPIQTEDTEHNNRVINVAGKSTSSGNTVAFAVDDSGVLSASINVPTAIGDGSKDVSVAGSAETLVASSTPCKKVWIWCNDDNSGAKVYVGGSSVSSTSGKPLYNGETIQIEIDDLQKIYIDVDTSGDGVRFSYTS